MKFFVATPRKRRRAITHAAPQVRSDGGPTPVGGQGAAVVEEPIPNVGDGPIPDTSNEVNKRQS